MRLLITGSTGIAAAAAALARERGHAVVTVGLDASADLIADLRDEAGAQAAFEEAVEKLDGLDGLFNCAGGSGRKFGDGPLHEVPLEGFQETLKVNLRTMFLMTRSALRWWLDRQLPGAVVQMGSVTAFHPQADHFAAHAYAAAKGAVESMTMGAAAYYARQGIRLNVVTPGLVRTPMSQRAQTNDTIMQYIGRKQPLTGILEPDEVARVVLFLLSDEAGAMTGQVVGVDGGWSVS